MNIYRIRADINYLRRTLNIGITVPSGILISRTDIAAKDDTITFKLHVEREETNVIKFDIHFDGINFVENSLEIPRINADHLNLSLLLGSDSEIFKCSRKNQGPIASNSDVEDIRKLVLSNEFACHCVVCSQLLFKSNEFEEVSLVGNYSEAAESAWCLCRCGCRTKHHKLREFSCKFDRNLNEEDDGRQESSKVDGRKIFVSEEFVTFEGDGRADDSLAVEADESVLCAKCRTVLGTASCDALKRYVKTSRDLNLRKLYVHSLRFSFPHSYQIWPSNDEEFEMKLSNLLASESKLHSRFVVEIRKRGNVLVPFLLITVLGTDGITYSLDGEVLEDVRLAPTNVVRILTRECTSVEDARMGMEWLKEIMVGNIEIPEWRGKSLLEIINCNSLLSTQSLFNGSKISYLKRPQLEAESPLIKDLSNHH